MLSGLATPLLIHPVRFVTWRGGRGKKGGGSQKGACIKRAIKAAKGGACQKGRDLAFGGGPPHRTSSITTLHACESMHALHACGCRRAVHEYLEALQQQQEVDGLLRGGGRGRAGSGVHLGELAAPERDVNLLVALEPPGTGHVVLLGRLL